MRCLGIVSLITLFSVAGCTGCPNYYGPGLGPRPYGSCVDTNTVAPPIPLGHQAGHHRSSFAERKQARDMRRWYKEINREDQYRGGQDDFCPHCQRHSKRRGRGYEGDYYDDMAYYDGEIIDGDYYDGQIIDGGYADGMSYPQTYSGNYCPDCQNQQYSDPVLSSPAPAPVPSAPPAEPTPSEASPATTLNEYYSPPSHVNAPSSQSSIPPVERIMYAPPVQPR